MLVFVRSFSYTPHASFSKASLTLLMVVPVRCFAYTLHADHSEDVMLRPNKDARARSDRLQLGTAHIQSFTQTRQVSVVMGRTLSGLLSALSWCAACLGRGSHRHASSGFVSVQTDSAAQSWHDLVRTSVFLFTLIVLFSEELLLHSSSLF